VNITHRGEYHLTITLLLSWAPRTAISDTCTLKISVAPLATGADARPRSSGRQPWRALLRGRGATQPHETVTVTRAFTRCVDVVFYTTPLFNNAPLQDKSRHRSLERNTWYPLRATRVINVIFNLEGRRSYAVITGLSPAAIHWPSDHWLLNNNGD